MRVGIGCEVGELGPVKHGFNMTTTKYSEKPNQDIDPTYVGKRALEKLARLLARQAAIDIVAANAKAKLAEGMVQ